ncbi:MAG: aspartate--tRNA(Asn) ligase [Nitrososphaerales archaeon]
MCGLTHIKSVRRRSLDLRLDTLGDWRRTHYSSDLSPQLDGKESIVFGWIASIRHQGNITFIILADKDGFTQITVKRGEVSDELYEKVQRLTAHTSIGVKGVLRAISKAPKGVEILPKEIKILSFATQNPPTSLYGRRLPSIDKRLEIRAVDLRRPAAQALFKIRQEVLKALRAYLLDNGYHEVHTPKIISSATEGGAALFPMLYYDKEAFLTQSPQLYKEQLVMAFEKVFEIGPAFRAEQSRTLEHLSEFISVDIEEAYVDYRDLMDRLESMIKWVVNVVSKKCANEFKTIGYKLEPLQGFKRYTYDEVLNILAEHGCRLEWGEDLGSATLNALAKHNPSFYFIVDWPAQSKPFYIAPKDKNSKISESFDLMYGSLEVASGGTRVSSRKLLEKRLKEKGLNPKSFAYHLKIFDYGMPPHAGFGLGFERLLMALTGQSNIREVTYFPRDQRHLTP